MPADPTSIIGSWDVVLNVPTNATPGALVTGAGEAWSHPHSSNLLTRGFLNDRFYGGSQWGVKFNGTTTKIDCGSGATLDDIPNGAVLQVEGWFRWDGAAQQVLVSKGGVSTATGWNLYLTSAGLPIMLVDLATTDATATHTTSVLDGKWHHIVGSYVDATRIARIAVDGVWGIAGGAGTGAYVTDAALNLNIGMATSGTAYYFSGSMGWINIHNDAHYTPGTDFLPVRAAPAADVEQWLLNEGTGVTATAQVTAPGNNGTITAGTWEPQWYDEGTPVRLQSVEAGTGYQTNVGSGATIDDLADNAFTVEGWFRITKSTRYSTFFRKGSSDITGWYFGIDTTGKIYSQVYCATTNASSYNLNTQWDGLWHYWKFTFDDAGDRKIRIYIDNVEITYAGQSAGVGAILSDAGTNGYISTSVSSERLQGAHGWVRWSNVVRGAGMIPRSNPPAVDGNTVAQWNANEGAGAVLTDSSGNLNHGAMAGTYSWNNSPAMESDSPGARNYAWGYVFGGDAANEGFKQNYTVVAGNNYTFIAGGYSEDGVAKPKIVIRDETAGVDLRTILGTVTSTERVPDRFHTCFQAPVGCTSISIKLLNETATGVVGWNQCMLKSDLWIDAGFEVGTAVTDVGTPTTSAQSADQAHTGVNSWKVVTDADDEGIKRTINVTSGKYYTIRAWMYVATAGKTGKIQFTNGLLQASASVNSINDTTIGSWKAFSCVVRATAATIDVSFLANSGTTFYVDDVSVFANDDVSLTVTPASAANSVESGGIRVDGFDLCTQPIPTGRLFATSGWVRFRWIPRHNAADALKFGCPIPIIATISGDVNNYIAVYYTGASQISLYVIFGGAPFGIVNWTVAGAIVAGGSYLMEVRYTSTEVLLIVDGITRITSPGVVNFGTIPSSFIAGSNTGLNRNEDSVLLSP